MDTAYVNQLLDNICSFDRSQLTAETPEALDRLAKLRNNVTRLGQRLEDPNAKFWLLLRRSALLSPIKLAVDMGLFRLIHESSGRITSRQLSEQANADEGLIIRTLRILAAEGFVEELGPQTYGPLPAGEPFLDEHSQATLAWALLFLPIAIDSPAYWAALKHQTPDGTSEAGAESVVNGTNGTANGALAAKKQSNSGVTQYANPFEFHFRRPGYGLFDYTREDPGIQAVFASAMQAMRAGERAKKNNSATCTYPYAEVLRQSQAETAFVDVAGGHGQALREIHANVMKAGSATTGTWVLQDLQAALDEMKGGIDGVEVMANDMFEGQPVKGATVYHLRRVLHDWDDAKSRQILQHVVAAADAKQSRILIVDVVLPDQDVSLIDALGDHSMMVFGGRERSRRQWEVLLGDAGLHIEKVWQGEEREAVIECFKK